MCACSVSIFDPFTAFSPAASSAAASQHMCACQRRTKLPYGVPAEISPLAVEVASLVGMVVLEFLNVARRDLVAPCPRSVWHYSFESHVHPRHLPLSMPCVRMRVRMHAYELARTCACMHGRFEGRRSLLDWIGLDGRGGDGMGLDWIGLGWVGLDGIGLDWIGWDGIGLDWIGLDWIGLDGIGWDWIALPLPWHAIAPSRSPWWGRVCRYAAPFGL